MDTTDWDMLVRLSDPNRWQDSNGNPVDPKVAAASLARIHTAITEVHDKAAYWMRTSSDRYTGTDGRTIRCQLLLNYAECGDGRRTCGHGFGA